MYVISSYMNISLLIDDIGKQKLWSLERKLQISEWMLWLSVTRSFDDECMLNLLPGGQHDQYLQSVPGSFSYGYGLACFMLKEVSSASTLLTGTGFD